MTPQTQTKQSPKGWKEEELGEIAEFKRGPFGSSIQKSVCVPKGKGTYKLYEQGNIIRNDFDRGEYYINKEKFEELKKFELLPSDIVITCAGTLGKIVIVPENIEKGIINSVLMRIRVDKSKILKKFFIYYFKSPHIQNDISSKSGGVAIKNLFATKLLKKFKIPLPSLSEQQLIVSEIEKQFSRLEEAVKVLKLVRDKLRIYKRVVLKAAFSGDSWEYSKIEKIFKTSSGGTPSRANKLYYTGNIPWLKSGELMDKTNIDDSEEHISKEALEESSAKIFPIDTTLIAMYGATTGKIGIIKKECSTNQAICGIFPNQNSISKFIFYFLLFKRERIINQSKGGGHNPILTKR